MFKKDKEIIESIHSGWDPNVGGGWAIRLAARYGCYNIVKLLVRHGANPHLLSESGASTLQLAVYSGEHWGSDNWSFLLSCCDSSQLADGAAVAIIFNNCAALEKILLTGRCNTHIPTTLTGKTLEQLAKGYKLMHVLNANQTQSRIEHNDLSLHSPRNARTLRPDASESLTLQPSQSSLSPSVARFFQQTARQPTLVSPQRQNIIQVSSPTTQYLN